MNRRAYQAGRRDALAKFGGASAAGPDGASDYASSGSPVATTTHQDSTQNIAQNFLRNSTSGDPSNFTQPAHTNSTMQGGTPTGRFTSDTTGGQRDS